MWSHRRPPPVSGIGGSTDLVIAPNPDRPGASRGSSRALRGGVPNRDPTCLGYQARRRSLRLTAIQEAPHLPKLVLDLLHAAGAHQPEKQAVDVLFHFRREPSPPRP